MKKLFVMLMSMVLSFALCGAAAAQENESGAIIDLGESKIFSQEDLQSAVDAILAEFSTWEGTEMHLVTYAGDVQSLSELEYVKKHYEGYDEVAVFLSAFRSPKEQYGAWEPDEEYTYSWCAARKDKGEWNLINWGWAENFYKTEQYSEEDMTAAMNAIYAEMDKMEGTKLRFMRYAGDEFSNSQLEYINSLERGVFDECAVFNTWFISPKEAYGAWEPDRLYTWSFFLGRAEKGDWQIVTYGY